MAFIDAPRLEYFKITFFDQIDFDTPRLAQFINCTPTLRARDEVHVQFRDGVTRINLRSRTSMRVADDFSITISCIEPNSQLSSIEQICNSSLQSLSTVADLYIEHQSSLRFWKNYAIENTLWLQLLRPFTPVKNLYLSKEFAPGIAAALQELVGDRIMEVLPSLQNIFVKGLEPSGSLREDIGQFVAARQLSDHPIAIAVWD